MFITQDCYSPLRGPSQAQALLPLCSLFLSSSKDFPTVLFLLPRLGIERGREMRMEPHHCGSDSGETTWQEAALQVSSSGHHFPSSCPITMAHCALLFAQGLDTHLKSSRPSHLLRLKVPSSRKRWGNEAVKREYLRVLKSYPHLAILAVNNGKLFLKFCCSMVVSKCKL